MKRLLPIRAFLLPCWLYAQPRGSPAKGRYTQATPASLKPGEYYMGVVPWGLYGPSGMSNGNQPSPSHLGRLKAAAATIVPLCNGNPAGCRELAGQPCSSAEIAADAAHAYCLIAFVELGHSVPTRIWCGNNYPPANGGNFLVNSRCDAWSATQQLLNLTNISPYLWPVICGQEGYQFYNYYTDAPSSAYSACTSHLMTAATEQTGTKALTLNEVQFVVTAMIEGGSGSARGVISTTAGSAAYSGATICNAGVPVSILNGSTPVTCGGGNYCKMLCNGNFTQKADSSSKNAKAKTILPTATIGRPAGNTNVSSVNSLTINSPNTYVAVEILADIIRWQKLSYYTAAKMFFYYGNPTTSYAGSSTLSYEQGGPIGAQKVAMAQMQQLDSQCAPGGWGNPAADGSITCKTPMTWTWTHSGTTVTGVASPALNFSFVTGAYVQLSSSTAHPLSDPTYEPPCTYDYCLGAQITVSGNTISYTLATAPTNSTATGGDVSVIFDRVVQGLDLSVAPVIAVGPQLYGDLGGSNYGPNGIYECCNDFLKDHIHPCGSSTLQCTDAVTNCARSPGNNQAHGGIACHCISAPAGTCPATGAWSGGTPFFAKIVVDFFTGGTTYNHLAPQYMIPVFCVRGHQTPGCQ